MHYANFFPPPARFRFLPCEFSSFSCISSRLDVSDRRRVKDIDDSFVFSAPFLYLDSVPFRAAPFFFMGFWLPLSSDQLFYPHSHSYSFFCPAHKLERFFYCSPFFSFAIPFLFFIAFLLFAPIVLALYGVSHKLYADTEVILSRSLPNPFTFFHVMYISHGPWTRFSDYFLHGGFSFDFIYVVRKSLRATRNNRCVSLSLSDLQVKLSIPLRQKFISVWTWW